MKKKLNINFLTYSARSIRAFITEALPMLSPGETSNHIKTQVYTSNFDVKPRPKYTGFENVVREDVMTRKRLRAHLKAQNVDDNTEIAEAKSQDLKKAVSNLGVPFPDPFLSLVTLTGAAIPYLRICEEGLVNLKDGKKLPLFVKS